MALHENFREYTPKEIGEIKKNVCVKHRCPYLSAGWSKTDAKKKDPDYTHRSCNYILYTGKMRGCMPDECTYWKDKNVKKPRTEMSYQSTPKVDLI